MNIMFLTCDGFDTPNSVNHLSMTIIEDLLKANNNVYLVCSHKKGIYKDIPDILKEKKGFTYDIVKRKDINKNNFVKRYLDDFLYVFKAMKYWRKKKNSIDAVFLQSYPNSVYMAIALKLFLRKPVVYNLYDVFPGHAYDIGVIKSKFIYNALRWTQKLVYKLTDYTIAASEDMKNILIKEGVPENKIRIVYLWYDTERIKCISPSENKIIKKFNLPRDKFYVQYAGALGYVLDYKMIIKVAEILKNQEDIVFLIIGDGNVKNRFLEEVKQKNLSNVWYYPWQPLELIGDVYNACDIGFIPLKKGVIGNGVPSKASQLMACKKVIVNSVEDSVYSRMFSENNMGISINTGDPQDIANAILYLKSHPEELKIMGENAYNYVSKYYSREVNTKKIVELFKLIEAEKNKV